MWRCHPDCLPQALIQSLFHIMVPRFRFIRAHPPIYLLLKFPLCLSLELWGLLRCQRGECCLCISGSDRSPRLQGKLWNTNTHTVICPLFERHSYSLTILPVTAAHMPKNIFILAVWFPYRKHTCYIIHLFMISFVLLSSPCCTLAPPLCHSRKRREVCQLP